MTLLWLGHFGRHQAEYARAYERAIKDGSIDSVISWELGGYRCEDGTMVTESPEKIKEHLKQDPLYANAICRVEAAVRGLREARYISALASQLHNS